MRFGDLSTYAKNAILAHIVGKTSFSKPTAYLGLSSTDPISSVTEPAAGAYERKETAGSDWGDPATGKILNAAEILFVTPTAAWGALAYFFLADDPDAGNVLGSGRLGSVLSALDEELDESETTITVVDGTNFPASGTIIIEDEEITYAGKSTNDLTGCTRGAASTTAKAHGLGHEVFLCAPKTVGEGDTVRFSVGKLALRLDYSTV